MQIFIDTIKKNNLLLDDVLKRMNLSNEPTNLLNFEEIKKAFKNLDYEGEEQCEKIARILLQNKKNIPLSKIIEALDFSIGLK